MSGLRPDSMRVFFRLLHARDLDVSKLATTLGRSRATVTRVLNGSRRRGPLWRKLAALLTPEELALLDVAQGDPWNKKRIQKRPRWAAVARKFEKELVAS